MFDDDYATVYCTDYAVVSFTDFLLYYLDHIWVSICTQRYITGDIIHIHVYTIICYIFICKMLFRAWNYSINTHTGNAAKIISEVGEITDTKLHPESYLKDLPSCKTNNAFQQFSRDKCLTSVVLPLIVSFSLLIAADSSRRQHPLPTLCCLWTLVIVINDPVNKGYLCLNGLNWKQHLLL